MPIATPVAYYKFSGNSNDSIGSANGTDTNITYADAAGIFGNGASFNGSTSLMTLPSSLVRGTGDSTLAFWFKIGSFQTSTRVLWWDWTTVNNFLIYTDAADSKLKCQVSGSAAFISAALSVGRWYHAIIVRGGSTATLYINGSSVSSVGSLAGIGSPSATIYVGDDSSAASKSQVMLDEIYWSNAALSGADITALWNSNAGIQSPFTDLAKIPQIGGGGGNVTFDGGTTSGYGATMTVAHNTVTGDGAGASDVTYGIRALNNVSGNYLARLGFSFDTSSLGSGAVITSATLNLFGSATNFVNDSTTSAVIVGFAPANANNIVAGDFGSFSFTAFSNNINLATLSQTGYNIFTLNASGLAAINKTGVTVLGCISEIDRAITTIVLKDNIFTFIMSDTGYNQPKLTITYTANTIYTMAAALGTYTYTGNDARIGRLYTMAASVGSYLLTGLGVALRFVGWNFKTKHTTSFNMKTKHSTTFTSKTKNNTTWIHKTKH